MPKPIDAAAARSSQMALAPNAGRIYKKKTGSIAAKNCACARETFVAALRLPE
jgi:hypothetical protein